ncbi:MAG TPA: carboxypeptidase-like regulatory domain-containing protein [Acidobacteriota bacterium]|nr:carboxypeptidase-like regulatory domain-containing protein [Acidobacteriota bacterium]
MPDHRGMHRLPPPSDFITVRGVVKDSAGGVIPGVDVTCISADGAVGRETVSDDQGRFSLLDLPFGPYTISAFMRGFKQTRIEMEPKGGPLVSLPVTLRVGPHDEVVRDHFPARATSLDLAITLLSLEWTDGFVPIAVLRSDQGSRVLTSYLSSHMEPYEKEEQWYADLERSRSFYQTLLDLPSGPQRLIPHLEDFAKRAGSIENYLFLSELPVEEQAPGLAAYLDLFVIGIWRHLEGLPQLDFPREPPSGDVSEHLRNLLRMNASGVKELKELGAFEPLHLEDVRPFIQARLGMHLVHRERRAPLPDDSRRLLITIPVGAFLIYLDPDSASLDVESLFVID